MKTDCWLAIGVWIVGMGSICQGAQVSSNSPLKQTRDPYFNPKTQPAASPNAGANDHRILNPLYRPPVNSTPPTEPIQPKSPSIAQIENQSVKTLPVWQPPNAKTKLNPISDSKGSTLPPDSIIRNGNPASRTLVGDFSADLSTLKRQPAVSGTEVGLNRETSPLKPMHTNSSVGSFRTDQPSSSTAETNDSSSFQPLGPTSPGSQRQVVAKQTGTPVDLQAPTSVTLNPSSGGLASASPPSPPAKPLEAGLNSPAEGSVPGGALKIPLPQPTADPSLLEPTRLLAMVGNEPIFVGDMLFELNQMIEQHLPGAPEEIKNRERQNGIKMLLNKYIDSKLLYVDTLRKLPEGADVEKIIEQAAQEFDKSAAPAMMKSAGVESLSDFDAYLRMQGSSLRKMRLSWSKDQLTRYFMSQELNFEKEVTHQELLDEYKKNLHDYAIPAKARWEQITVRFDRSASRAEAERALVDMANKILYGANFASVAKKGSHGFTADKGGVHDWISQGELASKALDEAIFSGEVGKLSDKIETAEGFHIIRVLERTEAGRTPFTEAQVQIKERLLEKKRAATFEKHIKQVRQEILVVRYDQPNAEPTRVANDTNQQTPTGSSRR